MNTFVIDTYKTINNLKAKGFSTEQAEGIIEAIVETDYVTNGSLKSMFDSQAVLFKIEMAETRVALMKWVTGILVVQSAAIVALQNLVG